jgi:hypothetical protein
MDAKRPTLFSPHRSSHNVATFVILPAHAEYPGMFAHTLRHDTKKFVYAILGQSSLFLNTSLFLILLGMKAKMEAVGSTKNFLPL